MTDKIIIDGIDVSGCVHLDEWKHCNICKELIKTIPNRYQCLTEQDLRCEYYSNCYYKQFKRLEQENYGLNQELLGYKKGVQASEIIEFKAENERLKKVIEYDGIHNDMQAEIDCGEKMIEKYQNVLQEIKAIAETASPYIDNFEIKTATEIGYDYAAICNEFELRLHKVLELITKVEEE